MRINLTKEDTLLLKGAAIMVLYSIISITSLKEE